jgi:parallel beta-helix repeat protein
MNSKLRVFNVSRFGAVPSASDNAAAIQAAITACESAGGGVVYFYPGTYISQSPINITVPGVTLRGEGATIKSNIPSNGAKLNIKASNTIVENLKFDGNYLIGPQAGDFGLIDIEHTSLIENITIKDCTFARSISKGIRILGPTSDVKIDGNLFEVVFNCIFQTSSASGTPQRTIIVNNKFESGWSTAGYSGAIKLKTEHSVWSKGHIISNNTFDAVGQMGIELWKLLSDCTITGNTISGADYGISLDGLRNISVVGNSIVNVSYVGIECASGCHDMAITGNTVSGYDDSGTETTRHGNIGISCSNVTNYRINIVGNSIKGFSDKGVYVATAENILVSANNIYDCNELINAHSTNNISIKGNYLQAVATRTGYHIFMDTVDVDAHDWEITDNTLVGTADWDNLIIYRGGNSARTLTRCVIKGNNLLNAGYTNLSLNNGIDPSNMSNVIIADNYYTSTVGSAKWEAYASSDVTTPYLASSQQFGISASKSFSVAVAISAVPRWYKIFNDYIGNPIYIELAFRESIDSQAVRKLIVHATPYGQDAGITLLPSASYAGGGDIEEIIYNNADGNAQHEIWIKVKATTNAGTIYFWASDFPAAWITNPSAIPAEPTWVGNSYKLLVSNVNYWTAASFVAGEFRKGIISAPSLAAFWPPLARLYIRGPGPDAATRVARFDKSDGTEAIYIDENGYLGAKNGLLVGSGTRVSSVYSATQSLDWGSIAAGAESTATMTVTGASTSNTPSVLLGWSAALPAGIICTQAWVSAANTISITLRNTTAGAIDPAAVTVRATVTQF